MKIFIITIHHIHNFGSVYQAWALNKFLVDNGFNCEVIDYRPDYFNYGRNKLKSFVGRLLNTVAYKKRSVKFEGFIRSSIRTTRRQYHSVDDLRALDTDNTTVFISGGDQLWNDYHPCGKDSAYKLSFVSNGRKIAYGTSMGRSNYTDGEIAVLAKEVSKFEAIMIRESSSVPLLGKHTAIPVRHVIDPVGLLDIEDFRNVAKTPNISEPYAVMYLADSSPLLDKAVAILSKQLGLRIVHICGFRKKCYCHYMLKDVGPEEILGYIMNSEFVLSASFHATMFSILFNKPFASILPGENTNARIEDVLKFFGLGNRIVHNEAELVCLTEKINFANVNGKVKAFRNSSAELLLNALKSEQKSLNQGVLENKR